MDPLLDKLKQSLESAVEGMSNEQLSWHPPGKWCAAELLEHLYLTYTGTIKGFERVLSQGKPLASRASVAQRALTLVVVGFGYMPAGRKAPAMSVRITFTPSALLFCAAGSFLSRIGKAPNRWSSLTKPWRGPCSAT